MKKERIDVLCVEKGLFDSREKAKRAIMAGIVRDDYDYIDKPGTKIPVNSNLYIKGKTLKYVSRGGLKLEKALESFELNINDVVMLDIGSSTGGFTDCALMNGAKYVYALDVGTNQLAWKLRNHPSVKVMENTNFRYATIDMFDIQPNFATIDVSFISLRLIFPPLSNIICDNGYIVALIKPQFEAGREDVGKNGIVRDKKTHKRVVENVINYGVEHNLFIQKLTYSPITGGEGNIEFLGLFKKNGDRCFIDIDSVIEEAHSHFGR